MTHKNQENMVLDRGYTTFGIPQSEPNHVSFK